MGKNKFEELAQTALQGISRYTSSTVDSITARLESAKTGDATNGKYVLYPLGYYPAGTYTIVESITDNSTSDSNKLIVALPLPNNLSINDIYAWGTESLPDYAERLISTSGKFIKDAINGKEIKGIDMDTLIKGIKDIGMGAATTSVLNIVKRVMGAGFDVVGLNSGTVIKEALKQGGVAYNPNAVMYFNGIQQNRTFDLAFTIAPLSSSAATHAAIAIKKLLSKSAPDYVQDKTFFTYPSYFKISVWSHGKLIVEHPSVVLKGVTVTFDTSGGTISTHEDGVPVSFTLNLNGCSSKPITAKDNNAIQFMGV